MNTLGVGRLPASTTQGGYTRPRAETIACPGVDVSGDARALLSRRSRSVRGSQTLEKESASWRSSWRDRTRFRASCSALLRNTWEATTSANGRVSWTGTPNSFRRKTLTRSSNSRRRLVVSGLSQSHVTLRMRSARSSSSDRFLQKMRTASEFDSRSSRARREPTSSSPARARRQYSRPGPSPGRSSGDFSRPIGAVVRKRKCISRVGFWATKFTKDSIASRTPGVLSVTAPELRLALT